MGFHIINNAGETLNSLCWMFQLRGRLAHHNLFTLRSLSPTIFSESEGNLERWYLGNCGVHPLLRYVWWGCIWHKDSITSASLLVEESEFLEKWDSTGPELDELVKFLETVSSELVCLSGAVLLVVSGFFVLRKRPPQPLALLIACRCRDSWR